MGVSARREYASSSQDGIASGGIFRRSCYRGRITKTARYRSLRLCSPEPADHRHAGYRFPPDGLLSLTSRRYSSALFSSSPRPCPHWPLAVRPCSTSRAGSLRYRVSTQLWRTHQSRLAGKGHGSIGANLRKIGKKEEKRADIGIFWYSTRKRSGSIKKDGSDPRKPLPPMEEKASFAWKTRTDPS